MKKLLKPQLLVFIAALFLIVACDPMAAGNKKQDSDYSGGGYQPAKRYGVVFSVKGGDYVPKYQIIEEGGKAQMPDPAPQPTDPKKIFRHWATEPDGNTPYDFNTPVKGRLELYAVWGIKITLKLGNGAESAVAAVKGATLPKQSNTKKKNALFKHWSTAENGSEAYDFTQPVTEAFTLHAVYYEIPETQKRIYAIQGSSHTSPDKDQAVSTVPGIVTGIRYSSGAPSSFYMQDQDGDGNAVTSDGIYVYCAAGQFPDELTVGAAVTVTGTVTEHAFDTAQLATTQIKVTAKENVKIVSHGNNLPAPVEITADKLEKPVFLANLGDLSPAAEAIDYYESLECMRVKIATPKVIAATYRNTQYVASASAKGFTPRGGLMYNSYDSTGRVCVYPYACFATKAEANVADPEPTIGDSYTGDIIGVLGYSYGNYQVEITEALPALAVGHIAPESSAITFDADKLNIVSYNLENFSFATKMKKYDSKTNQWSGLMFGHSSHKPSAQRAQEFADHFINNLKAPDIICLIEIQDDNSGGPDTTIVSAKKTLKLLTDKIALIPGAPAYKAVNIDPEHSTDPTKSVDGGAPGANIRCCYLYRDDRIELVPDSDSDLTNSDFTTVAAIEADGSKLTQNPARIGVGDPSFTSCRKSLVAHFKFKGSLNGGKDFFVINNHLTSKRGDGSIWGAQQPVVRVSEENRWKQADAITAFINSVKAKRSDARIISVGDYNDFWFSDTIAKVKAAGMKNAIESLPVNERYTYVYDGHSQTLDNILVTNNISIDYADVLHLNSEFSPKVRLSDHDPVFVQLSW